MEEKLIYFYNVGPSVAKKLINKMIKLKLIKDKDDNLSLSKIKKILLSNDFYNELHIATKYDLLYNPTRLILRKTIDNLNSILTKNLKNKIKFKIAGSYLRGKKSSSDVDIVIINNYTPDILFNKLQNLLSKDIKILYPFAIGPDKIATLIKIDGIYIKVDMFLTNDDEYIFALLFATGSGSFNILMRYIAKRKGYKLNQKGLWDKDNKKIKIKSEMDVFNILNMKYRLPENR